MSMEWTGSRAQRVVTSLKCSDSDAWMGSFARTMGSDVIVYWILADHSNRCVKLVGAQPEMDDKCRFEIVKPLRGLARDCRYLPGVDFIVTLEELSSGEHAVGVYSIDIDELNWLLRVDDVACYSICTQSSKIAIVPRDSNIVAVFNVLPHTVENVRRFHISSFNRVSIVCIDICCEHIAVSCEDCTLVLKLAEQAESSDSVSSCPTSASSNLMRLDDGAPSESEEYADYPSSSKHSEDTENIQFDYEMVFDCIHDPESKVCAVHLIWDESPILLLQKTSEVSAWPILESSLIDQCVSYKFSTACIDVKIDRSLRMMFVGMKNTNQPLDRLFAYYLPLVVSDFDRDPEGLWWMQAMPLDCSFAVKRIGALLELIIIAASCEGGTACDEVRVLTAVGPSNSDIKNELYSLSISEKLPNRLQWAIATVSYLEETGDQAEVEKLRYVNSWIGDMLTMQGDEFRACNFFLMSNKPITEVIGKLKDHNALVEYCKKIPLLSIDDAGAKAMIEALAMHTPQSLAQVFLESELFLYDYDASHLYQQLRLSLRAQLPPPDDEDAFYSFQPSAEYRLAQAVAAHLCEDGRNFARAILGFTEIELTRYLENRIEFMLKTWLHTRSLLQRLIWFHPITVVKLYSQLVLKQHLSYQDALQEVLSAGSERFKPDQVNILRISFNELCYVQLVSCSGIEDELNHVIEDLVECYIGEILKPQATFCKRDDRLRFRIEVGQHSHWIRLALMEKCARRIKMGEHKLLQVLSTMIATKMSGHYTRLHELIATSGSTLQCHDLLQMMTLPLVGRIEEALQACAKAYPKAYFAFIDEVCVTDEEFFVANTIALSLNNKVTDDQIQCSKWGEYPAKEGHFRTLEDEIACNDRMQQRQKIRLPKA